MSAQEYIETYKVGVYLQDAIKIILDRREEKPLDLFLEYLNTTLKGEHVLLREYAFVSATPLNRRCFLQQVKKIFLYALLQNPNGARLPPDALPHML